MVIMRPALALLGVTDLQAYARTNPEERQNIERAPKFRDLVVREFEQLYFAQR